MHDRATRLAPLTGLAFVVLVIVGGPGLQQSTPSATATPATVVAFYTAHQDRERIAVYVLALAFGAFLSFAASLRARWRERPGCEGLSTLLVAGATVEVVGQGTVLGATFALAAVPRHLAAATAQALNLIVNDMVVVSALGFLVFFVSAGLAILRGPGIVPAWLGWVAFPIGVLFLVPPIEFIGFLALLVWTIVVSVVLVRARSGAHAVPMAEPASR